MTITEIEYGSIASSKKLNDNFNALNKDIQDLATSLNTTNANLATSMSTLNKNVTNQISEVNESLANTKKELEDKFPTIEESIKTLSSKSEDPDYSKLKNLARDTLYIADVPKYIWFFQTCYNARYTTYTINDANFYISGCINQNTDTCAAGVWFRVGKGDKYRLNSGNSQGTWQACECPIKGAEQ